MPLILLMISLLPLPLALTHKLGRRFEEVLPVCWSLLVAAAYFLGLAGVLSFSYWLMAGLWLLSVAYLLVQLYQHGKNRQLKALFQSISGPGLWLFLGGMVFLWWVCRGRQYINWDEYSHWGRAIKAMVQQDVLPALAAGKDGYREYACGPALFQYLSFQAAGLEFRPDVSIFTQDLFALSFLLFPLRWLDKKQKAAAVISGCSLFMAPFIVYYNFYMETTVDGLLGVLFAILMLCWAAGGQTYWNMLFLTLTAFLITITKSSGIAFVAMAFCVAALTLLARRKALGLGAKKAALFLLLPLGGALLGKYSWSLFLKLNQVPLRWQPDDLSWQTFTDLFKGQPLWRKETVEYFCWNIFKDHNYGSLVHMPYAVLMLVSFVLAGLLIFGIAKKERGRWAAPLAGVCVCGVVYTVSTLFTYLFWFDPFEARVLASLSRYLNTCLTAIFVMLAAVAGLALCNKKLWQTLLGGVGCAAFWLLACSPGPMPILKDLANAPMASARSQNMQRPYTQAAQRIQALYPGVQGELPVFVVAQHDYGLTTLRLDYALSPSWVPEQTSSIGSPYEEDDRWTKLHTPETLAEKFKNEGFEYVYLYEIDDKFLEEFAALFDDPKIVTNHMLFKIDFQADGSVRLQLMQ